MNSTDPQRDPLDDLLSSARWPQADDERLRRVQERWDARIVRRASHVRRLVIRYAAVAAALLLAVGTAWWAAGDRAENAPPAEVPRAVPEIARPQDTPSPGKGSPAPHRTEKPVLAASPTSRPATPLETAMFRSWQSQRQAAAWQQDAAVEAAIDAIRYDRTTDRTAADANVAAAARPLLARRAYSERRLLESARYFDGSRRHAALKLLGRVGTTRTIRDLLPLVDAPRARDAAVATILQLATPEDLALYARREGNPAVRRGLLATLAAAGDARSVGALLTCVVHDTSRPTALDVLATARPLPTASLLAWLESPDAMRSAAAATALAAASDPAATEKLIALARSGNTSRAALVALVGSAQPAAQEFIAAAQRTHLVAAVHEAQFQWRALHDAAL